HQVRYMPRLERRADRRHRARLGEAARRGENRGAAEAVADEKRGRRVLAPQEVGGGAQIVHVRGEGRGGEIAAACAEAGEVEAQHRDAARGEPLAEVGCGLRVLRAGEAMGEDRPGARSVGGEIEAPGELVAL